MAITLGQLMESRVPDLAKSFGQIEIRIIVEEGSSVRFGRSCGLIQLEGLSNIQFQVLRDRFAGSLIRDSMKLLKPKIGIIQDAPELNG